MRTPLLASAVTLALSASLLAQQPAAPRPAAPAQKSQEEFIKLRDEKLAKPVFKLAKWNTDYDAVRAEAKASKKLILAYFTRSYAH